MWPPDVADYWNNAGGGMEPFPTGYPGTDVVSASRLSADNIVLEERGTRGGYSGDRFTTLYSSDDDDNDEDGDDGDDDVDGEASDDQEIGVETHQGRGHVHRTVPRRLDAKYAGSGFDAWDRITCNAFWFLATGAEARCREFPDLLQLYVRTGQRLAGNTKQRHSRVRKTWTTMKTRTIYQI